MAISRYMQKPDCKGSTGVLALFPKQSTNDRLRSYLTTMFQLKRLYNIEWVVSRQQVEMGSSRSLRKYCLFSWGSLARDHFIFNLHQSHCDKSINFVKKKTPHLTIHLREVATHLTRRRENGTSVNHTPVRNDTSLKQTPSRKWHRINHTVRRRCLT